MQQAARHIFGGWREAIEAAGIDYDSVVLRCGYSDEVLLDRLRALAEAHPSWTLSDVGRLRAARGRPSGATWVRRWGSIEAAAQEAGLAGWPVRERTPMMTKIEVIRTLRMMARRKEPLNYAAVSRGSNNSLIAGALVHFPSWDRAIAAADLPPQRRMRAPWTREEAILAVKRRHRAGLRLALSDFLRDESGLGEALPRLFGSHAAAMKAAGVPYVRLHQVWTNERVLAEIREAARARPRLTQDAVSSALLDAAQRRFGTWSAACRKAGVTGGVGRSTKPRPSRRKPGRARRGSRE
jgi:hypothetical protein